MPPTIHLVRHAQGVHNLGDHHARDATLTGHGIQQCEILARDFPFHDRVKTIIVSPLRRTGYTGLYSLGPAIKRNNILMIAHPLYQETGHAPCDTGLEPADLIEEVTSQSIPINTDLIVAGCNDRKYGSPYANSSLPNSMRAKLARRFLSNLVAEKLQAGDDDDIAVVTHGGFLHYLTEDWEGAQGHESVAWKNTEYRSFTVLKPTKASSDALTSERDAPVFAEIAAMTKPEKYSEMNGLVDFYDDSENGALVETPDSRRRRGQTETTSLTRDQQRELWYQTVSKWEASHVAAGWEKF